MRLLLFVGCALCIKTAWAQAPTSENHNQSRTNVANTAADTTSRPFTFTTQAYQREALRLVLAEANVIAKQLNLSERLPIKEEDLAEASWCRMGWRRVTLI